MTTYLIYADSNDGYLRSTDSSYSAALTGSNLFMDNASTTVKVGQNLNASGVYYVYQGFFSFDTSVIVDTEEIVDATISAYIGYPNNQKVWWDIEFRNFNWTAPLTTAQWKTPSTLSTYPIYSSFDIMTPSSAYRWISTGRDTLVQNISKTAATKFVAVSSRTVQAGNTPIGTEELWISSGSSVSKPYLRVDTVPLSMLNTVSEASTTLPDGTTISIRSNGTPTNNLTVGYTPLNSSTWTAITTLSVSLQPNIDGPNAVAITSDKDGNFYIFGQRINVPGSLYGQAWKRTGTSNVWTAQPALYQQLPTANEQTIRSIAAQYMPGGKDANDKPSIHILLSRGASGVNLNYRYHVSGTGFTQNAQINPESLLAGSGSLINAAAGFNPAQSAIPAFVDMCPVGDHLNACYVQRGNVNGTIVGGLSMVQTYNKSGKFTAFNNTYVLTGSSQLVPISDKVFAHVFEQDSLKLTVRFYNAQAQVLGETFIPKESFWGGTVGAKFAAYYDKTSDAVRVFYVDVAASNSLSRFDVSPVTFIGTTSIGVATIGAAASTNDNLRISRTSDERRVMIESANTAAGVISVATAFSTVGNLVPNAPSLTVRPNYDAATAATFSWTPSDPNPADTSTAYQLEISRVSDSVVVYDTGKVTSTATSAVVAANVLANAINYRWRVRTYDVLGATGTWSGYGTFTTSATGTLTITSPATDNVLGIETDDYLITWTYDQASGQTQSQRRVRLIRTADSAVISDTTMQASSTLSYTIAGMESGKEYRVEVSLVNSASVSVPVVSRLITPDYSQPMTPDMLINYGESYIEIVTVNPLPTGDRPEVVVNDIYKRRTKSGSQDSDFVRIASVGNSSTYRDFAVKSGTSYDYKIIGLTS